MCIGLYIIQINENIIFISSTDMGWRICMCTLVVKMNLYIATMNFHNIHNYNEDACITIICAYKTI